MAVDVTFTDALPEHAIELAPVMRPADVAEVLALGYSSPREALESSLDCSTLAFTALFDGKVAAMFGTAPIEEHPGTACVWLLTGREVQRHPRAFLKASHACLRVLLDNYPRLVNLVDSRYAAALRWAKWLGFELGTPRTINTSGVEFTPITIRRSTWARR